MKRLWIILVVSLLWSCQDLVDLPLATIEGTIPVIEAQWTDIPSFNEVTITLAKNYFDSTQNISVNDADVSISIPGTEISIPFVYDFQTSRYRPVDERRVAKIGEKYELRVTWKDNLYISDGLMLEPPSLDSLVYEYEEERVFRDEGYYIKVFGKIPFEEDNFYRIKIIENDTLLNDPEDYLLFDDTFGLTFFEEGLELGYAFEAKDRVRLVLYRLNEPVFNYFNQLVNLLFTDGGLFSPPPQNPDTNIRRVRGEDRAEGYFMVSPIITQLVFIDEEPDSD